MINEGIPEWWNGLDQDYFNEYLAEPDDEIDELVKKHLAEIGKGRLTLTIFPANVM